MYTSITQPQLYVNTTDKTVEIFVSYQRKATCMMLHLLFGATDKKRTADLQFFFI